MGLSNSVLFKYFDHQLIHKRGNFFWVWYEEKSPFDSNRIESEPTLIERGAMKVTVQTENINRNNYSTLSDQIGKGPLIVKRGSNYRVLLDEYIPSCVDPGITYYKLTSTHRNPSWTKTFYIREIH